MKTPYFCLLCLFLSITVSLNGQTKSDSIWAIWSDEDQSLEIRLDALYSIDSDKNGLSKNNNVDSFFYRATLMYDLAQANGLKEWEGRALLNKGNYHNLKGSFKEAMNFYIQGKELGEKTMNKKLIAGGNFNIALIHMKKGEADKAIEYFSIAIKNFEEIGDKFKQSAAMDASAMIYQFMKSDPKKALTYLEPSLKIKEELIKTDDNPKARFVLAGIKQTIKSIKESFEEVEDTLDLDAYNSEELKREDLVKADSDLKTNSTPIKHKKGDKSDKAEIEEDDKLDDAHSALLDLLRLNEKEGNKRSMSEALNKIGIFHEMRNNLDSALHYYSQSLKVNEEVGDMFLRARTLGLIGKVHSLQGNIESALTALNQGRSIFQELGNYNEDANLKNIIGTIYLNQKEYEEALEIFTQSLEYHKSEGNRMNEAGALSNIGNVLRSQGKTERALENYDAALKLFEEIKFLHGVAGVNLEIGGINFEKKEYELALENMTRSLSISKKIGYKEGIALAQSGIAEIYAAQNKHNEAIAFASRSLVLSQEFGNIEHIMNSSKILSESYKVKGRYKEALEMKELHYQMRDSIQSEENQKAVIQLKVEANYEKQKVIDDLENEKLIAIEKQKKENQQKLSFAIGLGLLFISLLALVIFNKLKLTRKQKTIIEKQKKKVEQSEKYKEQFLANMSHEIRTPMHAISGMVKILKRNEHLPNQDVFLNAMHSSSDNLVVILNDVLDISKIEAGKLDIEHIPMNPADVIENVIQILKFKAEEKGLKLNYQVDEEVPAMIMGDPTRLNQILINLVGNGIKFTEKGSVDILLSKENDHLRYSIKDTGIGISNNKIESIFNAFQQANESTSRHYGGTGLGLSISKQLVELQNGKIWAENNSDKDQDGGSTFYVELPLVIAATDAVSKSLITEETLQVMAKSLKGIRILMAEDNAFNQMIAQDDLSYLIEGVKIDTVENGALAVEKYKTGNYDLILMDVQMPNMNGFDATREIRKLEKLGGIESLIPIIAMTASLLKSEVDSCYDAGMNNYIPKPYKIEELIQPIHAELNPD